MPARRPLTFALAVAAALICAPAAQAGSLAAAWLLDENTQTVIDWSGNGNRGVLGNTSATEASDPVRVAGPLYRSDKALRFEGSDRVTFGDSATLEPTEMTFAAIVRSGSSPGQFRYVFSKGALGCISASYGLYTGASGGLAFYVSNGVDFAVSPQAPATIWDGKWHLVVGSFDGSRLRLYVDKKEVGTPVTTTVSLAYGFPDNDRFYLGDYGGPCTDTHGFVGDVAAAAIWDKAYGPSRDID